MRFLESRIVTYLVAGLCFMVGTMWDSGTKACTQDKPNPKKESKPDQPSNVSEKSAFWVLRVNTDLQRFLFSREKQVPRACVFLNGPLFFSDEGLLTDNGRELFKQLQKEVAPFDPETETLLYNISLSKEQRKNTDRIGRALKLKTLMVGFAEGLIHFTVPDIGKFVGLAKIGRKNVIQFRVRLPRRDLFERDPKQDMVVEWFHNLGKSLGFKVDLRFNVAPVAHLDEQMNR